MNVFHFVLWMLLWGFFTAGTTASVQSRVYTLTNTEGVSIEAQLIGMEPGGVKLQLNGQVYIVPIANFSEESQKVINEWERAFLTRLTKDARIEVELNVRIDGEKFDLGVERDTIHPEVIIKNRELERDFKGITGRVILISQHVEERDALQVLSDQTFEFEIARNKEFMWEGKPEKIAYRDREHREYENGLRYTWAKEGYKYDGYILMLRNDAGEVVYVDESRRGWREAFAGEGWQRPPIEARGR